ncbi:MAG: N-glycosylase/DNA lyase [Candidatus Diapherotrites archaeon]|jgi:N-glycosylase/DNA lyase|uniref:8-oxoguanine DNA glycosylase/AP lyase n=1 Tax=Candidatus Iainarchaeum sp. TaxID=3101447 RepID=A0A8T5GDQ1_9ARCH|nr:N-glycosylase/DNA lyase [Candidatus Diapherotrites archaeon]MBT7240907.1 N-glycosylase/DNA lyase [Candidatus Diapherotrites archaeon]
MPNICSTTPTLNKKIKQTLREFKSVWKSDQLVFEELCFCLLTPQSSAKQAFKAIDLLRKNKLLSKGSAKAKEKYVRNVRFYITKAKRLEIAQKKFPQKRIKQILKTNGLPKDAIKCREFLVKEVNGYGYKEASHFLRNIGFGKDIAILDRHILKNLLKCKIIKEIPQTITKKSYLAIEEKMKKYCEKNKINFAELDLIFWSNETGNVLK